jgi:hypothetical protein
VIVRRVRRLHPATVATGQAEMFAIYRSHAVFTDSPEPMLAAEATHRDHAIIEQVIADLKNSALAHLPSGVFTANAAWLVRAQLSRFQSFSESSAITACARRCRRSMEMTIYDLSTASTWARPCSSSQDRRRPTCP